MTEERKIVDPKSPQELYNGELGSKSHVQLELPAPEVDALRFVLRDETQRIVSPSADSALEAEIQRLQKEGQLPESFYVKHIAKILEFLGRKLGITICIGGQTFFPGGTESIEIPLESLRNFLKRGAIAGTFALGLIATPEAFAQNIQPGTDMGFEGHAIIHWETILFLLMLLGVSGVAAHQMVKKLKKTDTEKAAFLHLSALKTAGTDEEKAQAKKQLLEVTMMEMPAGVDAAALQIDTVTDQELKKAMKIKKKVDAIVQQALSEIEQTMELPEEQSVQSLNEKRDKVYQLAEKHIHKLSQLLDELTQEASKVAQKLDPGKTSYLLNQIEFEKKKIKYILEYIILMKKKWLLLIQNAKNALLSSAPDQQFSESDQVQKNIFQLKNSLNTLLSSQAGMGPSDFIAELQNLEILLDQKIDEAKQLGMSGYESEEEKLVGSNSIVLLENGNYAYPGGIHYRINGADKHVNLYEGLKVQIWINEKGEIRMNLYHQGNLVEKKELSVSNGELCLKENGQSLQAFIDEKNTELSAQGAVTASAELPEESAEVLSELASKVLNVSQSIKAKTYGTFGDKVEADDEAIDLHLIRIHKELFQGKEKTSIRFKLTEHYWKKALAHLKTQNDVPKHSILYDFETDGGGKKVIQQPMIRFNVMVGSKSTTVLISENTKYLALAGEVKILLDSNDEFSADEVKQIFAEVSKRLGIQDQIHPVTEDAKERLREKLKKIRKETATPAGTTQTVHQEYDAEQVQKQRVDALKHKGLHSVYHQCSVDRLRDIFKIGKVLCTATRWGKGIFVDGMSSLTDMTNGGAETAYTRIHTKNSAKQSLFYSSDKPALIFSPQLLGRMDCYCYTSDRYGSKLPHVFSERVSPEQLVDVMSTHYNTGNEAMFHDAVDLSELKYIVYSHPAHIIQMLSSIGVQSIGGRSLQEAVITPEQFKSIPIE